VDRYAFLSPPDRFEAADVLHVEHRCSWLASDAPRATVSLRTGSNEQYFADLSGGIGWDEDADRLASHNRRTELMEVIDATRRTDRWIGTDEERNRQFGPKR
jgi:hypothetical protein